MLRPDIENTLRPKWVRHSAERPALILTAALANVQRQWPTAEIVSLNIPADGNYNEFDLRLPHDQTAKVFTDSQSGEVLGTFDLLWLNWLVDLHHNLLLGKNGKRTVGYIGIFLFFTSLSGLGLFLIRKPKLRTAFRIRRGVAWKVVNFDLHRALGLFSNALLLAVSITGVALAFPETVATVFRIPREKASARPAKRDGKKDEHASRQIEELLAAAQRAVPGGTPRQVRFPTGGGNQASVRLWLPTDLRPEGNNRVRLEAASLRLVQVERASDWSPAKRWTQLAAPVHYGEWGGALLRILWACIGLVPPVLFVSGIVIWVQPHLARRARSQRAAKEVLILEKELVH